MVWHFFMEWHKKYELNFRIENWKILLLFDNCVAHENLTAFKRIKKNYCFTSKYNNANSILKSMHYTLLFESLFYRKQMQLHIIEQIDCERAVSKNRSWFRIASFETIENCLKKWLLYTEKSIACSDRKHLS